MSQTMNLLDSLKILFAEKDGMSEEEVTPEYILQRLREHPHSRAYSMIINELSGSESEESPEEITREVEKFLESFSKAK